MKRSVLFKTFALVCVSVIVLASLVGCSAADNVNHNLRVAADNFECLRRITVYNARTDLIILEMEGYMSISNNTTSELVVTCKTDVDEYRKNYIYLNEFVIYVVEDISGNSTDPYHYKVHFYTALPDVDINH